MNSFDSILDTDMLSSLLMLAAGAALVLCILMFFILPFARIQGRAYRNAGRRTLVYLESAARLGAPLPEMMEAAAATESGKFSWRLIHLSRQLRDGRSLRDALA